MSNLGPVSPARASFEKSDWDLDAFRVELDEQRRFRLHQLEDLANDMSTESHWAHEEVTSTLVRGAEAVVAEIDAALLRIEAGTFGLCQQCDNSIDLGRLKALPRASLCMLCHLAGETNDLFRPPPYAPAVRLRVFPSLLARTSTTPSSNGQSTPLDIVEVWGFGSFPASDPPANW